MNPNPYRLPEKGIPKSEVLAAMKSLREKDVRWQEGRVFSLIYYAGEEITDLLKEAFLLFFSENGLNPTAFPSLRQLEIEVVGMASSLLRGEGQVVGNMTSGGTESILLAVKSAREWAHANRPEIREPEMILPFTAHPAFEKAAHYFDVKAVRTPIGPDFRADVVAAQAAITPRTILMVGSAPAYPFGVVDPIAELAAVAKGQGILFHADACVGGFFLPFVRKLGYPVPDFDFAVPGVTSISADLHKYGYCVKGASVILYREPSLRRHQFFVYTDWPGGIYASPTMAGTRPAGPMAAAWAVMRYLGEEGYLALAALVMDTTHKIRRGVEAIPGLKVLGEPDMSIMALASDTLNIYDVGDEMALRGWHLDRQQFPPSLHMTVMPVHAETADDFLRDLTEAADAARRPSLAKFGGAATVSLAQAAAKLLPERWLSRLMAKAAGLLGKDVGSASGRSAAMYGMMGTLPNRGDLRELVLDLLDGLTRPETSNRE
jgi:sphinganine-1-phosphate aldolase